MIQAPVPCRPEQGKKIWSASFLLEGSLLEGSVASLDIDTKAGSLIQEAD